MSVANIALKDTAFGAGMNEGIDATVLPAEQLAYLQNARVRKPGRIGKRNGYAAHPLTLSGQIRNTAGAGVFPNTVLSGNICGAGDRLLVVNDTAYGYSDTKAAWYDQFAAWEWQNIGNGLAPGIPNNRPFFGHVAGWRPVRVSAPAYQEQVTSSAVCNCDTEYFNGLHWVVAEQAAVTGSNTDVQVSALDPVTDRVVWTYTTGGSMPRLMKVGAFLVLTYLDSAGTLRATQFIAYGAAFMGGLSAGALVAPFQVVFSITGGSGYHAIPFSATQILFAYQSAAGTITLKLVSIAATGFTAGTTTNYNPAAAGPYFSFLASDPGNGVTLAWKANDTRIYARLFTTAITATGAEITVSAGGTPTYRPSVAYNAPGGFPVVAWSVGPSIWHAELFGGVTTHRLFVTPQFQLASAIFYLGSKLYCWAASSTEGLNRYLFLLNLDDPVNSLFPTAGPDVGYVPGFDLSLQDRNVTYAQDIASGGLWLGKCTLGANGYIFAAPFVLASPGSSTNSVMRLVQANHYSESVRRRSICMRTSRNAQLMAGGVLSAFYSTGAYEVGFLGIPSAMALVAGAGGSMTTGGNYSYCCVWRWINPNGETELSAQSAVSSVNMGANNKVTLTISGSLYTLGAKSGVALDIYRSLNGAPFQYVGTADNSGTLTYVDMASDISIAANAVLYTQVGQELANATPPACRFLSVSQNRVWLGGLSDPRVVQSSKAFLRGVALSFADDDAFRVTLPDPCTGMAFLDSTVVFTRNAIYVIGGDGPDNDGTNGWAAPVSLPFPIGCIDWRSIVVSEEGIFFQSDRGLYMLPRGFGEPIPAGDSVMDQLRTFGICTGAAAVTRGDGTLAAGSSSESTIRWSFCQEEACTHGILVVYDRVHKVWSVDKIQNPNPADNGPAFIATWQDGANAQTPGLGAPGGRMFIALDNTTPQLGAGSGWPLLREITPGEPTESPSSYVDQDGVSDFAFQMLVRTGQLRPFGLLGHGLIHRVGALLYAQSTTSVNLNKTTNIGTGSSSLALTNAGVNVLLEFALGNQEGRDVNSLILEFNQTDFGGEGALFNGFVLETGEPQGFAKLPAAQRGT